MVNPVPIVVPPPPPPPILTPEQIAALSQMQLHLLRPGLVLEVVDPGGAPSTVWIRVKEVYAGIASLTVLYAPHDGPPKSGVQIATEPGGDPPPKP
jgi:hypothetical protein